MNKRSAFICLATVFVAWGVQAASLGASASVFDTNRVRGTLNASTTSKGGKTYTVVGGGVGYFPWAGLEIGLDGEMWLDADPAVYKVSPGVRYVVQGLGAFYPYAGGFYRRTFYEGLDDLDSYGARYGVYMPIGPNTYAGVGGVYEKRVNCDKTVYEDCVSSYPELSVSVSF